MEPQQRPPCLQVTTSQIPPLLQNEYALHTLHKDTELKISKVLSRVRMTVGGLLLV